MTREEAKQNLLQDLKAAARREGNEPLSPEDIPLMGSPCEDDDLEFEALLKEAQLFGYKPNKNKSS